MGRSQLKYRSARGRGQGDSTRGGRGGGSEKADGGGSWRGRGSRGGGRPLESNAFRYEARNEEGAEDASLGKTAASNTGRQFFAEERQYRNMGEAKESYFRTKAMEEWDADDDVGDEVVGTVGIMDFKWIAEQLATVAPSLRFQIDQKYCVEFGREDPLDQEAEAILPTAQGATTEGSNQSKPFSSDLDELLALSSATATAASGHALLPTSTMALSATPTPSASGAESQENLEDWLDDVLDM